VSQRFGHAELSNGPVNESEQSVSSRPKHKFGSGLPLHVAGFVVVVSVVVVAVRVEEVLTQVSHVTGQRIVIGASPIRLSQIPIPSRSTSATHSSGSDFPLQSGVVVVDETVVVVGVWDVVV